MHRFTHVLEKTASLALRHGRTEVVDTYLNHYRIREGDAEAMTDAAYTAWRTDRTAGLVSVLVAETRDDVTTLNQRARADLILDGALRLGREVELTDGTTAGSGTRSSPDATIAACATVRSGSATETPGSSPASATTARSRSARPAAGSVAPSSSPPLT